MSLLQQSGNFDPDIIDIMVKGYSRETDSNAELQFLWFFDFLN